jgi:flagellar protein FlgJ
VAMGITPTGMAPLQSGLSALASSAGSSKDSPAKIHDAANQFEALLIGQILKSAQSNGEGWLGTNEDQAGASTVDFASDYLARSLASQGGLGLSRMISKSLEHAAASSSNHATSTQAPAGTPHEGL